MPSYSILCQTSLPIQWAKMEDELLKIKGNWKKMEKYGRNHPKIAENRQGQKNWKSVKSVLASSLFCPAKLTTNYLSSAKLSKKVSTFAGVSSATYFIITNVFSLYEPSDYPVM